MCKKVWRAIKLDYSSFFYSIAGCSATIIAIIGGFIASKLISISADRDNILDKIKEINDELNMKTKQHDDIIEKLDDDDALDFVRDRDITGKVTTEDIEAEQICNEEEK